MLLNKLELKGKVCCAIMFLMLFSGLFAQNRNGFLIYENLERPIADMTFSSFSGIHEYGLLFALSGNGGGLAYFTSYDSLSIFPMESDAGVVSIAPDEANNRIFCAVVGLSNNDGLYEFNVETEEFELITNTEFPPKFVKKLSSGFYFGYGFWNMYGGLMHSTDGDVWEPIEFFDYFSDVTDIAENGDGTIFISAYNQLFMENNGNYSSFDAPYRIHAIFVRSHPYSNEVYIACGEGYEDDAVYRVEYNENEITGLTLINYFTNPQRIYQYGNQLVVGCNSIENSLFLVEPVENGNVTPIPIDEEYEINEIYSFEFYPIYTHNFIVGTNSGVYLFTNLTSAEEQTLELTSPYALRNYPNPFNPSTTIQFSSELLQPNEQITLEIYNIKGQRIRQFTMKNENPMKYTSHFTGQDWKMNEIVWDGKNDQNETVSSGIYFYQLKSTSGLLEAKKMILMK